ncbi:glutamyl-tRNA amidotransferase [Lophiostoma macrostomum CBS 122681]|uniref:Glutamyl-tRNA amidotransferase n=1 Tax=Lophiostoma macrostomum CBS 122681 TaxID=1314788 RepID=A0A6A6T4C8_9PLEO|nr:glutamyl-tRNA amidotransferase [Lophiostoma macrostomum CBS 122681]
MRLYEFFSIGALASLPSVFAAVSSTGYTVSLTDISYFIPPKPVGKISIPESLSDKFSNGPFVPLTVFTPGTTTFTAADISTLTAQYLAADDVFQEGFLEVIYVEGAASGASTEVTVGNISSTVITSGVTEGSLNPGPYFINAAGDIFEAWRLYSDTNGAFTESAMSNGDGSYSVLPAGILGQKLAIAVPSRLYFTKTDTKPLAGLRFGIKDIYDVKGLRRSNGNRAWYWLYPPANATATPVQNLIDAGAVIVGKMITSQFANGETATADWVDYHESFNPRGDGYQDTSSSSAGGGAGTAAYGWLDVSLGSDTGGSVRGPAQVQGLYGNRPSHGIVSLEHTMPLSPVLDTSGLIARDPLIWKAAAKAMYKDNITFTSEYPSSITTLSWPTSADTVADQLLLDFLANVTTFLRANATALNISTSWTHDNPSLPPLEDLLNITYPILISQQQIPLVRDPFYADYAALHDGRRPFVDPVPLLRWSWAQNSSATVPEAIANKTLFMSWFNSSVLTPSASTCSSSLLMYVGSIGSTVYRNIYLSDPVPPYGFGEWSLSGFAEAPDFVVPIGEAPYNSTVTGHVEYLPVTVDFMAAKGCDGMLFELIEDLHRVGILKTALPGRSGVSGGEILFRRGMGMGMGV